MREKAIVVGLTVALLSSASYALDPLGPPKALLGRGNWGLGVEYAHSQTDVELTDQVSAGTPIANSSSRLRADRVYASLRYGVWEDVDVFARLGAVVFDDPTLQDGDADLAWGLGVAATLRDTDKLAWGGLVQFSRGESSAHAFPTAPDITSEIEAWSIQVAGGPTYQVRDNLAAYAGLFFHMFRGEFDRSTDYGGDLEENDSFGGFAGLDWEVQENAHWTVEFQYAGSTLAVATGVRWSFD